jgi:hypothetical protein
VSEWVSGGFGQGEYTIGRLDGGWVVVFDEEPPCFHDGLLKFRDTKTRAIAGWQNAAVCLRKQQLPPQQQLIKHQSKEERQGKRENRKKESARRSNTQVVQMKITPIKQSVNPLTSLAKEL